jgi:hypothetical protein
MLPATKEARATRHYRWFIISPVDCTPTYKPTDRDRARAAHSPGDQVGTAPKVLIVALDKRAWPPAELPAVTTPADKTGSDHAE